MREFELLRHVYAANAALGSRIAIPPGDDMGMVQLDGRRLLAAVDQIIDGVHFRLDTTPLELIGRKAVTRSLSDIAAMAARPVASLVAVTLPVGFGEGRATCLFDSMRDTAAAYDCPLIGGDIAMHRSSSAPLVCSVTVLAEPAPARDPVTRCGARPGDGVYVTGALGGSLKPDGLGRHLTFEPRIAEALALAEQLDNRLHAMIDISDGLGRDASHIAEMSGVQIVIDAQRVPCQPGCDWRRALSDGEDYELCFAASGEAPAILGQTRVTKVGECRPHTDRGGPLVLMQQGGRTIPADELGWQHQ